MHEEQTGELPISEKQQVSEEPEHASVAGVLSELQRAEEAAEHISALVSGLLPPSADGPRTPKSSANTSTVSKLSKTATSPAISSAPLPAETMTPKPGSANAPNRPNAVVRRSSVNKDKPGSGGGLRRSSFDREDKRSPLRRSSFDREDKGSTSRRSSFDREGGGRISPSTPKDSDRSTPRSRNRASFDKEGEKGSGALRRSSFDRSGGSTHQSGARSMHVSGSANAHQQGGKVGSASVRQPASRRTTAPGSTLNAPAASAVASTTTTAAVPVPVPECVPSIPEVSSLSLLEEQEDQLAPLPANFAFGDVDHSETPDASGISGADFSLPPGFADASTISEGNEYSDMSGFDNPENAKPSSSSSDKEKRASSSKNKAATSVTSSVASSASASAAEKERVKKEKEDHAKAVKDKANQKKKDAEDKRKADAAKAKAARDERENSKHETSKTRQPAGASKTDKSETSRHVKPAPPRKLDSKSNSAGSKVGDSTAAAGGDGEEGDDQHSELPSRVASHDAGATTPKGMSPSPRSNPPTPKVPKSGTTFAKPNIDPEAAALKIQKRARVKVSAKKVQEKKEEIISAQKKLGMLIHWAVVTIQRNFRGRKGRKKFISQQMAKQVELAQKKEKSAQLIQSRARGIVGRKKANFIKAKVRQEKQEIEWMESYQKDGGKKINLKVEGASRAPADIQKDSPSKQDSFQGSLSTRSAKVATSSKSLKTPDKEQDKVGLEEEGEGPAPAAAAIVDVISPAAIHAAQQAEEMNERIRKLEEIERTIREKEEKMAEYARKAEEQAQAMQNALLQMQEQAKKQEDDRLAQQQLLAMAAGPMSHRSDYASPFSTQQRRAMGTGGGHGNSTMPMSSRRSVPNSARHPDAPPTARSARGGAAIPPDAPHVTYNGEDWVQLWDPDEAAYYWYCERTQFAQWDEPGAANNQSSVTIVANYLQNVNEGDDSGYESAGAMTDWSTDHDGQSAYTSDSEYESSVWQEFWDESAQAKYWYNNNTVSVILILSQF